MSSPKPRWKLLIGLLLFPVLLRAAFRFTPLDDGGFGGAASVLTIILVLILALVWLLLFSRLPWRRRLTGLLLIIVMGVGLRYSVRIDGYMGEFFPQLAWVWTPKPDERADELEITAAADDLPLTTDQPGDFPFFLGPNRNNWVTGSELPDDWPTSTPRELWRRDIGLGWGAFSVAGLHAYTMEQRGDDELIVCYHTRTGAPIWVHSEEGRFSESMGGDGPRSTPAVTPDGKVLALRANGVLLCLDGRTGDLIWRRDTLTEAGQKNLMWAKSCSPILVGDMVVVTLGNSKDSCLAAYRIADGELAWRAGEDKSAYSTPLLTTLKDTPQIVSFNASSVSAHAPDTGALLWQHKVNKVSAHNASPVVIGDDRVLVGMGYGRGSYLFKIDQVDGEWTASEVGSPTSSNQNSPTWSCLANPSRARISTASMKGAWCACNSRTASAPGEASASNMANC